MIVKDETLDTAHYSMHLLGSDNGKVHVYLHRRDDAVSIPSPQEAAQELRKIADWLEGGAL